MNDRERFLNFCEFKTVDRPPRWEWSFRDDTTALWRAQGLPPEVPGKISWRDYFMLDSGEPWMAGGMPVDDGINLDPDPPDDAIISENESTLTRKNKWGATVVELKIGESIPQYVDFAVQNRRDFRRVVRRWNPADPGRYPADWARRMAAWKKRDWPMRIRVYGWYFILRELMGVTGASMMFYDDPELVDEICEFWTDFLIAALDRALADNPFDYVMMWEDLAFKNGPLLSPAFFSKHIAGPCTRFISHCRSRGISHFMVDSDGDIGSIMPLWIDAGVDILGPFEVAAGMDVVKIGRRHPQLIMTGGIDKMQLARGPAAIRAEVDRRVKPLRDRGGYIPSLDHSTIPELTLSDYRYYREYILSVTEP